MKLILSCGFIVALSGALAESAFAQTATAPAPQDAPNSVRPLRATPTSRGGPGDPAPTAAGPGGALPSGTTAQEPDPNDVRALRATPAASGGPGDPASAAAGPGGFRLVSKDNRSEIRFRALVQADGRFWFDDKQRPGTNGFLIRRAQTWAEGRLPYGISFILNPDFGQGTVVLQDAYLGLDLVSNALKFRAGKFRPPFGLERLQPTSNLSFVEFGLPTSLTPNRDVGAMLYGDLLEDIIGYAGGVFNSVADNAAGDLALDKEKEFDGRVYLRPFRMIPDEVLGRLFVGVAGTFGRVYGTASSPNLPSYKTPGQSTFFSYTSGTNTVVADGPHNRYGAYLYEALGPFSLMGEYYLSDQEVALAGSSGGLTGRQWIHNKAYQVQATFVLFGADASYDFVHVKTPFDPAHGHFGAVEVAGRFGHLALDHDAFPQYASTSGSVRGATEGAAGVNWYMSDNAKFVLNWDHTAFQGGAKTPLEQHWQHREAENIWLVRAQVVY
ncbi:MAG: porin [Polyangiaceae bacterium]|nr:porin [Polyangiaceae bacterium]